LFYFVLGMAARMQRWPLDTISSAKWLSRVPFFLSVSGYIGLILLIPQETAGVMAYNSVMGTCYSVSAILFLSSFRVQASGWSFLAERTYFLYLSHILVVNSLLDLAGYLGIVEPFWFSVVTLIVAIAIPLFVLALLKPLLRDRSRLLLGA
jgi:peptidoglycan/LPS O-acetylase OafA/YrhL